MLQETLVTQVLLDLREPQAQYLVLQVQQGPQVLQGHKERQELRVQQVQQVIPVLLVLLALLVPPVLLVLLGQLDRLERQVQQELQAQLDHKVQQGRQVQQEI